MNQTNQAISVDVTKLFLPPIPGDFIPRRQLREQLARIERRPLTIVSAPAGYGKTVTISAWLQEGERYRAWLTLDEGDNQLNEFLTYFLAALHKAAPIVAPELAAALEGPGVIPIADFLTTLNASLNTLEHDIVMVLDDFQVITNPAILTLITEWMRHPHPTLHLVLLTRHDPGLPLATWRARNQVVDIRSQNLRFSTEEEEEFLRKATKFHFDANDLTLLRQGTEGWAAALRLVTLSLAHSGDLRSKDLDLTGMGRQDIMEYLASQVLEGLPAREQEFLLKTSILERVTGSLGDCLLADTDESGDGQGILEKLCRANLFLSPTSADGQWFRYHQLFQEFLRGRLAREYSPAAIAQLNARASRWLAHNGYLNEAIQHAVAAGELESVLAMVAEYRYRLMSEDRWRYLESWYRLLPDSVVHTSPDLLLLKGWLAHFRRFDLQETDAVTAEVGRLLDSLQLDPDRTRQLAAENAILCAVPAYFRLEPEFVIELSRRGLRDLPMSHYVARSYGWLYLAAGQQMLGDSAAAYDALRQGRREDLAVPGQPQSRASVGACFVHWIAGDLASVSQASKVVLATSSLTNQPQSLNWGHYFLAATRYHQNRLDEALEHAQFAFGNRHMFHAHGAVQAGFVAAMVHLARGDDQRANEVMRQISEYAVWVQSAPLTDLVQAMQCELAVRSGRPSEACQWAEQVQSSRPFGAMAFFFAAAMTIPKALLAAYDPHRGNELGDYLRVLRQHVERIHNTRFLIDVLALEAMFHDRQGDEQAALDALSRSLAMAERLGFVRLHIDLGAQMHGLLARLTQKDSSNAFAARVRAEIHLPVLPQGNAALVEPLTERECEVLGLLGERLSNKEIAQELFIAEATVKRHTINIYQKLGVSSRREAVHMAQSLGLLD